ncbi:TMEM165/GDT1 family protein [Prochlorococcus marinus]|uniref:TMEM165/GDT1 family protein n=1 Tax=Prochlorococcus marinus TaxID=1219 RepID=UPI0022B46580|nr:TMEM165/GDT1 family protein [Prochlorococcus marinus]
MTEKEQFLNLFSIKNTDNEDFLSVIIKTFTAVFLAELGDKTQIATLLLAAETGDPKLVFIGSSLALICTSLIGVLIGSWLANKIPENIFNKSAGIIMIILSIVIFIEVSNLFNFGII